MDKNQTVVVMTYQEKLWWDFVDNNPNLVMWGTGIAAVLLLLVLVKTIFGKRY